MNLLLLEKKDFIGPGKALVFGRRFEHIKKVLKAKNGTNLSCGLIDGKMGKARITSFYTDSLELEVNLNLDTPKPLPLTLVLALPRPKMLKRIMESVTSLGVKEIYLVNSWRVEKSFWQSPVLEMESLEKYFRLGLEQGKDTIMPQIYQKRFFSKFVKEELPIIGKDSLCILAHPKTSNICPNSVNRKTTLVIGPEGGFIEFEIKALEEAGFETFSIGERILKVETATTYLISRLFT
ncbi:MAG: 16S rRNA (uracil(1498)-N(3))-methyltransferase [Desulfobacteraceae bacterium]|nr:16S rRNA (uracil(1498)-N(3))-methyltransferase [Desulfobacteraceae bacterium]